MMFRISLLTLFLLASSIDAWTTISRRDAMGTLATGLVFGPAVATQALETCPEGSVCAQWTPPSGDTTSKKDAALIFRAALETFPQQAPVGNANAGAWTLVEDKLESKGTARVEFKSSGKPGDFGKFLGSNKAPAVTDKLNIKIQNDGSIQVSGGNKKLVDYLAQSVKAAGWTV